ncbi:hypothetical protein IW138_005012 [Coemansia sp. RSA 986]|nr:hypothetical protein IW138_005012 [Coemansia sp. RSA 986]
MPKTRLTLAYFPETFRGMMATKDICKGDDIVRVPEHLLVTASKAKQDIIIACGNWSRTRLYVSAAGTYTVDDWRCYVWAWLAVNTRCIHLGQQSIASRDTIALAPFLDLLNHSKDASVTTYFDLVKRQFVIKTLTPYKRGREVFISYGPHDNCFMLAEYGFVLADNPFQALEMDHYVNVWVETARSKLQPARPGRSATVQPSDIDDMIHTLKQHGLWGDFALSFDDSDIPYRLHAALQLLIMAVTHPQQGLQRVSSKRVIAQWERWRRGEPVEINDLNTDYAIRNWVRATCQTVADAAAAAIDDIRTSGYAQQMKQRYPVDDFLAHCVCVLWEEISSIAKSFLKQKISACDDLYD